jgi:putative methionine-R-sulfoxide reductase with GAF domain
MRDYERLIEPAASCAGSPRERMQHVVDALWEAMAPTGYSWVGFYLDQPGQPDDQRLVLGPCRDKPACSPIGVHGVCGQGFLAQRPIIINDVADLGPNYIACDPRDRSEIVIPCAARDDETLVGVLDVDSWDTAAFDAHDQAGLISLLRAARLHP